MTEFIHPFLFPYPPFENVHQVCTTFAPYFVNAEQKQQPQQKQPIVYFTPHPPIQPPPPTIPYPEPPTIHPVIPTPPPKPTKIITPQVGTLYECLYRFHHGESAFDFVRHRFGNIEMEEREIIRNHLVIHRAYILESNLKSVKTKVGFQNLISSLMTTTARDGLDIVIAQCIYYGINVWLVVGRSYLVYKSSNEETTPNVVVRRHRPTQYTLLRDMTPEKLAAEAVELVSMDKFFLAASHYKIDELEELCSRAGVPPSVEKQNKTQRYNALCAHVATFWH